MAILTDRSNIRIGFEVECYIKERFYKEWETSVKDIHAENNISDDGSIEPPYYDNGPDFIPYEIQTAVLPPASAIENLKKIFELIAKLGGTNESCGLHLNISSTNQNRMKRFNPWPFISSPIWQRMVRHFNREDNDYCVPPDVNDNTSMGFFENICNDDCCSFYDKDSCVNFANWNNGTSKYSRVEIRGMGGNKYHFRLPLITNYTKKVIKLFMLCCDIPIVGKLFKV